MLKFRSLFSSPQPATTTREASGASRRQLIVKTLLAGAGIGLTSSSAALATSNNTSTSISHSAVTAGTSYVSFTGLDFKPFISTGGYGFNGNGGIYPTPAGGVFGAALNLPQASKITEVEFYAIHNNTLSSNFLLMAFITNNTGEAPPITIQTLVSNKSSSVVTVSLLPSDTSFPLKVDNTLYRYYLSWYGPEGSATNLLYGARVGYTGGIGRFAA